MTRPRPLVLVVLDGFGLRTDVDNNAVELANAPRWRQLLASYPHSSISASGPDVGLPEGQFGNSEVGHMNLGAGRIAQMDISRIDCAVADRSLAKNDEIARAINSAKQNKGRLHLLGLVSDGGVHSSIEHLFALIDQAHEAGVSVVVHAFLDGRDTPPQSAKKYLEQLETQLAGKGVIGTVTGRYWAMDRDKRWERVERAYRAIVQAQAPRVESAIAGLLASYEAGKNDEFVEPVIVGQYQGAINTADTALFFNFRADRAREISLALTGANFPHFERPAHKAFAHYVCMTEYDPKLELPVAFPKIVYPELFTDLLAKAQLTQLRCAETEKFAHVTFFFNGGQEAPVPGEERTLIASPRDVPTYDYKPEMSAPGVTEAVVKAIESNSFDFILVNFANPDMVGHTGILNAAITAVEAVDRGVGAIVDAVLAKNGCVMITADHGNCETMLDTTTGQPHTAHTTNPVPFVLVDNQRKQAALRAGGRLCDVAPTMLEVLGLPQPSAMTGKSLLG